ncbi:hypothetical protein Y032_0219g2483 [Ancylostoma ceylanicum]|nr:hypothetical protein Y032_0219g2483 [Ancylostoma ceylanicum]
MNSLYFYWFYSTRTREPRTHEAHELGFDSGALERISSQLKEKCEHATQIQKMWTPCDAPLRDALTRTGCSKRLERACRCQEKRW